MLTALEGVFTLLEQTSSELATSQGMAVLVYAIGEMRAGRAGSNAFEWLRDLAVRAARFSHVRQQEGQLPLSQPCLAKHLGVTEARLQDALTAHDCARNQSLDSMPCELVDEPTVDRQRDWLMQAMVELDPEQRRALQALLIDGQSLREVAQRQDGHATNSDPSSRRQLHVSRNWQ